ncbi:phenylacetate-CoA oxygenase subunit PaaJ [Deinococcus sp. HMF7620]|uniref:Phenylacetate-CoA oxygenase subunit PaaJ n=1 Tax=Deinococcus arboris TaxID=2682977 RepID=A0A7C9MSA2_9DEIO|nr:MULTISPECIES: 1,2-phenylacetyl-CoA epoxidase subunit PaaD [Deinococcus]MBZ9751861.1 phenylacetate-CoA oxygenase subunit PaaJ [Deinococcus betulae]MVN87904.1 phenylacetate-CoA oxygenase subunit PaaJ [Deinococcus arboris]
MAASPTPGAVWQALNAVPDPEIPVVSITDMGMVRDVTVDGGGRVQVTFTPTFSGCPALHVIRDSIEQAVKELGVAEVEVKSTLTPPWTTDWINEDARERLRQYGIAPPAPAGEGQLIQLEAEPTRCPRCSSFDVRMTASFGPTLCKRMYVCDSCKEPFEGFKSV